MQTTFTQPGSYALQFKSACLQIGRILDVLQSLGMTISLEKTVVLLSIRGPGFTQLSRGWIRSTKQGRHLIVPTAKGEKLLPIKTEHNYLGVVIGYKSFERATVKYRVQQSWSAFHRLYRFLTSRSLPIIDRLRLWRTCVRTVLLYGLSAIQLDAHCCSVLCTRAA